ncbi:MAG: hypothetical protein WC052_04715 [Patescibacteria group bacterium]|jgi:hypothetical protein
MNQNKESDEMVARVKRAFDAIPHDRELSDKEISEAAEVLRNSDQEMAQGHLQFCHDNPGMYGLCAWCKHYFLRADNSRISPALTEEQFEATRLDGTSHGCCPECRDRMIAEAHEVKS